MGKPVRPIPPWKCSECHRLNQPGERRCGAWLETRPMWGPVMIKVVKCSGVRPRKR